MRRQELRTASTVLARLRRHTGGNVMAMAAIGTIPLVGMIGGALDLSRGYLVRTRLQQACDASVLAGRRSMNGSTWSNASKEAADTFFNANFNAGRYGATKLSMEYAVGVDNVVHGTAKATVPTTLMRIFDKTEIPLTITCDAELQLPNSDIMFVLDTTLSMAETNAGDTTSKIAALRTSVTNFYNALERVKAPASQVRYGFVPYASNVNVGMLLKPEWMVDEATYQSRQKDNVEDVAGSTQGATTTVSDNTVTVSGNTSTVTSTLPSENCAAPANTSKTTTQSSVTTTETRSDGVTYTTTKTRTLRTGSTFSASVNASTGICTLTETRYNDLVQDRTQVTKPNPNAGTQNAGTKRYWWNYMPVTFPVTALKGVTANGTIAGGNFMAEVGTNHTMTKIVWGGTAPACIEERQAQRPGTTDPAYDMDVDLVPTSDVRTRWRPAIPALVWARAVTGNYAATPTGWNTAKMRAAGDAYINVGNASYTSIRAACPSPAKRLGAITSGDLANYLNGLKPAGQTYHDIGFLWGLRLMSPNGLFSADNATASNGGSIARHLIFMTDGDTRTNVADYEAYGLSALDRRRTAVATLPTDAQQNAIVEDRLLKLCAVAKDQKNITVWVIAFGTSLTPLLSQCASPNRAYEAKNSAELDRTFSEIASHIAQLRVTR